MTTRPPTIQRLMKTALHLIGSPYLWGAKGWQRWTAGGVETLERQAFDCSGFYTHCLSAVGGEDLRFSHNTDRLWAELAPIDVPRFGALAFYGGSGPADVSHVMLCVGGGLVVGASGGDSSTTSLERAEAQDARVRVFETHAYRKDFRGFRMPHVPLSSLP